MSENQEENMGALNNQPSDKQVKALQLIREGMAPCKAMKQAGYKESTSEAPSRNLLRSEGAKTIIEQYKEAYTKVGITPDYMGGKTKEWLEAQKIKSSMTEPDKVIPDYETQLKAAEMVRKDWGMEQPVQGQNINLIQLIKEQKNKYGI